MYNPIATYRIQFHKEFTLADFETIIPYLQKLGVSTIYASPIFAAVPGSTHGYDGVNPQIINPEIGTEEQLRNISKRLKPEAIGWLQDIVPNHMAFHHLNTWLMDILEKGMQSTYASFFDVAWNSKVYKGQIMVPFLGSSLDNVIANSELKLAYENNKFVLKYYENTYPLNPRSYEKILTNDTAQSNQAIKQLVDQMHDMHQVEDAKIYSERWNEFLLQLTSLYKNETVKTFIEHSLDSINNNSSLLREIADSQVYRLCHWQETDHRINYRRFFTVNGLVCLNIQDQDVFNQYHQFIKLLTDEGIFDGLRIDHIDGLYDPTLYLQQLREIAGEETYIVVEKILEPKESLPAYWPIQGNTGYDFLSIVNNLFTDSSNTEVFTQFYEDWIDDNTEIAQQLYQKKSYILYQHMNGELENLYRLFIELNLIEKKYFSSIRPDDLKTAIGEFLIQCPVYRYYGNRFPLDHNETAAVQKIINRIKRGSTDISRAISLLEKSLLHKPHEGNEEYNKRVAQFYQRCMQFTGPLMAKGMEDTLMYTYNRFIGHNEVGDSPEAFGYTQDQFHQMMIERQEKWPLSLNATSTHDTKRGEDVRARLNVLTDLDGEWTQTVLQWRDLNKSLLEEKSIDPNDEYFIYQSILGAHPMPGEESDNFTARLQEYLQKALREAKVNSNWTDPNEAYEKNINEFIASLLGTDGNFRKAFDAFHQEIADFGIVNSLSQTVLKFACPGVPDVYQGCELWDLSLVDPDNRRPVDYSKRATWLDEFESIEDLTEEKLQSLWQERFSGKIKLWLTKQLFALRKQYADIFLQGHYVPLMVEGTYKDYILAFARKHKQTFIIVIVPLHTATLCREQAKEIQELDWKDTRVIPAGEIIGSWENILTNKKGEPKKGIRIQDIFSPLPFAILKLQAIDNKRGAGILAHVSSLPSPYAIGDMGPEAYAFAEFLHRSRQKYWQLLPLNPTEAGQAHSPYSSISSKAGNILFISPELLMKEGLLQSQDIHDYHRPVETSVNYSEAESIKKAILDKTFDNFKNSTSNTLQQQFETFCEQEKSWLQDFALYIILKQEYGGKPWFQWPEEFMQRKQKSITQLAKKHKDELEKIKWQQFIFIRQWKALKTYCNNRNIQLIGDMPFYISYDSVDVWSNREIFAVDEEGKMTGVAGVPPDAFSDDGQLWGMPVFKWNVLKEKNYSWWVERMRKNIELFDIVRLDHFRAFADYWEVPAGETTAKNGTWKEGPGADFFTELLRTFGELPFIAEDLGDINDAVLQLRDEFYLPGMNVLQFAFGEDMPRSAYIPHNYIKNSIAYTGTHDNNTTRGWFRQEADEKTRQRVSHYFAQNITDSKIHYALGRLAYASVSKTVILPIQDVLGLDESARMNVPASSQNNWAWRLLPHQLSGREEELLREWTNIYNRE